MFQEASEFISGQQNEITVTTKSFLSFPLKRAGQKVDR